MLTTIAPWTGRRARSSWPAGPCWRRDGPVRRRAGPPGPRLRAVGSAARHGMHRPQPTAAFSRLDFLPPGIRMRRRRPAPTGSSPSSGRLASGLSAAVAATSASSPRSSIPQTPARSSMSGPGRGCATSSAGSTRPTCSVATTTYQRDSSAIQMGDPGRTDGCRTRWPGRSMTGTLGGVSALSARADRPRGVDRHAPVTARTEGPRRPRRGAAR
jgi:hypothetical protein